MFSLMRLTLIVAVLLVCYPLALICYLSPLALFVLIVCVLAMIAKRRGALSDHGTARWAEYADVEWMVGGEGLYVGEFETQLRFGEFLRSLFDPRVSSKVMCEMLLRSKT